MDASDDAIAGCDGALGCLGTAEAVADHDATPVTVDLQRRHHGAQHLPHPRAPRRHPAGLAGDPDPSPPAGPQLQRGRRAGSAARSTGAAGRARAAWSRWRGSGRARRPSRRRRWTRRATSTRPRRPRRSSCRPTSRRSAGRLDAAAPQRRLRRRPARATKVGAVLRVGHQRDVRELRLIGPVRSPARQGPGPGRAQPLVHRRPLREGRAPADLRGAGPVRAPAVGRGHRSGCCPCRVAARSSSTRWSRAADPGDRLRQSSLRP